MVGRAQSSVASLLGDLVSSAASAGQIDVDDPEGATFLILSVNAAFITAATVGTDVGVSRPDLVGTASFCLRGLGADLSDGWYDSVDGRLRFPAPSSRSSRLRRGSAGGRQSLR